MIVVSQLMCILFLINLCHGLKSERYCGGAWIDDYAKCVCGNETITEPGTNCCGPDTCSLTDDGARAVCPDGVQCQSYYEERFTCGDIIIPMDSKCQCGTEQLTIDDYWYEQKFCCPSSSPGQCTRTQNGDGNCNGTVKVGKYTGCNSGVCWSRNLFACKSGDECVWKHEMCLGKPLCSDRSDVEACNVNNNDLCDPNFYEKYYKCPGILPFASKNQQCYNPSVDIANSEYDCLSRSDEPDVMEKEEIIDYESIKPCFKDIQRHVSGLMCGNTCKENTDWCNKGRSISCRTKLSTFHTDSSLLCRNKTFWSVHGEDCNDSIGDIITAFGKRCLAKEEHCYASPFRKYNPFASYSLPTGCSDLSDQVYKIGSKCNITKDIEEYCETFCPSKSVRLFSEDDYDEYEEFEYFYNEEGRKVHRGDSCIDCKDKEAWIKNLIKINSEGLDPRQCQSSCLNPSYNCKACTHPDYSFTCEIDGVLHCINSELICDGHPACDDGSDENLNRPQCFEKLVKNKAIKPQATVICQSPMYDNIETVAVPCNNVVECRDSEDEQWLCASSKSSLIGPVIALIILFIISLLIKYCKRSAIEQQEDNEPLLLPDVLDSKIFNKNCDQKDFKDDVNLFIQKCKLEDEKEIRIAKNKKLYNLVLKRHNGNVSETALYIKETIDPENANVLLKDAFPGIIRRYFSRFEDFQELLGKKKTSYWLMHKAKNIASVYMDICKDTYLMFVILFLIGGPTALIDFPSNLASVVVFCQFGSIVIPLIITGILHANDEIDRFEGKLSLKEKIVKYSLAILKSPITPMFIAQEYDDNKIARKELIKYNKKRNDVLKLFKEGTRVRQSFGKFIRIDLGLEVFFQLSGQVIYLLLTTTTSPTTGGLEILFKKSNNYLFVLSIALSLRTIYFAYLKTVSIEKPYLPTTSKLVLFAWIIISGTLRLMVVVLFFTPAFGLFSTLSHWRMEQIPFAEQYRNQIETGGTLYLYQANITKEQWNKIDRWDYTNNVGPHYTLYTGFNLRQYFLYFWLILIVHVFINILVKIATSEHFRKNCDSFLEMIVHGLENANMPSCWRDWDLDHGSLEDHKQRHAKVLVEMILIMITRALFHLIMLTPVFYTGNNREISALLIYFFLLATNVWKRNALLESTIGPLPEEKISESHITTIFYVSAILFPVLSVLEIILYCVYQCKVSLF